LNQMLTFELHFFFQEKKKHKLMTGTEILTFLLCGILFCITMATSRYIRLHLADLQFQDNQDLGEVLHS